MDIKSLQSVEMVEVFLKNKGYWDKFVDEVKRQHGNMNIIEYLSKLDNKFYIIKRAIIWKYSHEGYEFWRKLSEDFFHFYKENKEND